MAHTKTDLEGEIVYEMAISVVQLICDYIDRYSSH